MQLYSKYVHSGVEDKIFNLFRRVLECFIIEVAPPLYLTECPNKYFVAYSL